jgi:hypothetical protein
VAEEEEEEEDLDALVKGLGDFASDEELPGESE